MHMRIARTMHIYVSLLTVTVASATVSVNMLKEILQVYCSVIMCQHIFEIAILHGNIFKIMFANTQLIVLVFTVAAATSSVIMLTVTVASAC